MGKEKVLSVISSSFPKSPSSWQCQSLATACCVHNMVNKSLLENDGWFVNNKPAQEQIEKKVRCVAHARSRSP